MGRPRAPITTDRLTYRSGRCFCYLRHPVRKRVVCFSLGPASALNVPSKEASDGLEVLNKTYLDETLWLDPPEEMPTHLRDQWLGPDGVIKLHGTRARRGKVEIPANSEQVAILQAENDALTRDRHQLLQKIELLEREVAALRGKKYRRGASPSLRDAVDKWLATWKAEKRERNPEYVKTVTWDLERFVRQFGESTTLDKLDGAEDRINTWLNSLQVPVERDEDGKVLKSKPISPSRLRQVRIYLLKMLTESGCELNRKRVLRPSNKELKESRGGIRWLTKEQAQALLKVLPGPFADAFRIQVAIGLRPNELLTLHASHFERDFSILHLQRLGTLRLKTGPRTIPIPDDLRPTLRWRAQQNEVLFPHPETGMPYSHPKVFTLKFKSALTAAAAKARIRVRMDSRIGRRTCASLLIQANVSAEKVADLLGNSAAMILDHYGDPNTKNLFNSLKDKPTTLSTSEAGASERAIS